MDTRRLGECSAPSNKTVQNIAQHYSISYNRTENRRTKNHVPPKIRYPIEQKRRESTTKLTKKLQKTECNKFLNNLLTSDKPFWTITERIM